MLTHPGDTEKDKNSTKKSTFDSVSRFKFSQITHFTQIGEKVKESKN